MSRPELHSATLPRGTRLGHYEIVSILGKGGMGEVYRGRDTRLDRSVAIKVLPAELSADPERRQRFEREARTISGLSHPHICALHDVGREGSRDFLVLEYLEGETLAERLHKGPLATEQALRYAIEIAEALDSAHRQGIVHRDLKPGNVMLTRTGAKLLDFGLAKAQLAWPQAESLLSQMATGARDTPLTAAGMILGTFQYTAPEQLEGREADARSDIFSFGALLHEMLSGQKAFSGRNAASLIGAILHTEPPPISSLQPLAPPELERIVRKCLAKDPDDRWQSARDLADALRWVAQGGSASGIVAPAARRRRSWRPLAVNMLVAAATAAALLLLTARARREPARTVQSTILPPEGHAFSFSSGAVAVSPDGRMIAFVASPPGGPARLFVRPLHGLTAQALAGTEQAGSPFWSPDSRSLAFVTGGKLRRIEVAGGSSEVLCDAALVRGGSWSRDGVILFAPDVGTPIHRVAATGGVAVPITSLDPAHGESSHRWPSFLSDGRHFLYMAWRGPSVGGHPIYVGSLDGGKPRLLLRAASNAVLAPPGHLLFVRQGTLLAQRIDPRRLELEGDAFPVGERVLSAPSNGSAPFSASGDGVLVYQSGGSGESDRLVWLDRRGKTLETLATPGQHSSPRLSRDGRRLALSVFDARNDAVDLWIRDLERQVATRFTTDPTDETSPVWSPDGSRIVFGSTRNGAAGDLYLKPSGGGPEELLLASPQRKVPTDWSSDGRYILYHATSAETRADLWALSLSDRKPIPVLQTEFDESEAEFSPDGRWIAYRSSESGGSEVCVRPFPGPGGHWQVSSNSGKMPKWRADGAELFYSGRDWVLMAVDVKMDGTEFKAGPPRQLFEARMRDSRYRQYDVSSDGQRFLVSAFAPGENPSPLTLVLNWTGELRQ